MKKVSPLSGGFVHREKFAGNPAGVVPGADGLSEHMMQKIAREMNDSETCVRLPGGPGFDVHVRFFTPTREVPVCGHATVAAHYVGRLTEKMGSVRVLQKTGAGNSCRWTSSARAVTTASQ
jgi:PhzF family phenazine biosynthesis protein